MNYIFILQNLYITILNLNFTKLYPTFTAIQYYPFTTIYVIQ